MGKLFRIKCLAWKLRNMIAVNKLTSFNGGGYCVSIVSIMKNEGLYVKEWLDFHLLAGVDHFYIYDNGSTDNTKEILNPYVEGGVVTLINMSGRNKQLSAYNHAIWRYKSQSKYMAFIDGDEFLMSERPDEQLSDVIENIMNMDEKAGGIAVNWRMFGSSGHIKRPQTGVLLSFVYRAKDDGKGNAVVKTIVNPRRVAYWNHDHYPIYRSGFHSINEDGKIVEGWRNDMNHPLRKLRINHYFCKSQEEWIARRSMGKADTRDRTNKRTLEEFKQHDNNDVYDDIALRIIETRQKDNG